MKCPRRKFLRLVADTGALSVLAVALANVGAWPQAMRTIKIVVPYPPGASADIPTRMLAEQIGRTQGVTFVETERAQNRTGELS